MIPHLGGIRIMSSRLAGFLGSNINQFIKYRLLKKLWPFHGRASKAAPPIPNVEIHWLGATQGTFYLATGIWPLLHLKSFLLVTGPKTDLWLVKTVASLIVCIGLALLLGSLESVATSTSVLAISSAAALATVDVYFAAKHVIRKIYLLDAVVEAMFIIGWIVLYFQQTIAF